MLQSIPFLQNQIEQEIISYSKTLNGHPEKLYEPICYMLNLGGKRIRPLMTLLSCDLFGEPVQSAINAAIAVEIFHNFTLIHDDIMDNASKRRSKETVHKKWNTNIAILAGDAMMIKSYQLLCNYNSKVLPRLLDLFNKTALKVCEGQQLDMNYEIYPADINQYLKMIELKTAVLLAASLKLGAFIADASDKDADLLYDFGRNIGIAFQLQDDILDAFGSPEKFGKQAAGDIISNKKTFLYLKALKEANEEDRKLLEHLFSVYPEQPSEKINAVLSIFQKYDIKKAAKLEMDKYFYQGINSLNSINVDEHKKSQLKQLAESLMEREV